MKSYAAYIWPAYGVTVVMFVVLIVSCVAHARHWKRKAEQLSRPK